MAPWVPEGAHLRGCTRLPVTTRFLPHGHRLGVGLIGREALDPLKTPALARLAAWDVARYEQQGC